MKLKPLFDKIVVKEIKEEESVSKGGILLPKSAEEKPCIATVVSVGKGGIVDGEKIEMVVKPKDKIVFTKYAGTEFKIDNEKYIILKQDDVLAIIED